LVINAGWVAGSLAAAIDAEKFVESAILCFSDIAP